MEFIGSKWSYALKWCKPNSGEVDDAMIRNNFMTKDWNSLPSELRCIVVDSTFRRHLKAELYSRA